MESLINEAINQKILLESAEDNKVVFSTYLFSVWIFDEYLNCLSAKSLV